MKSEITKVSIGNKIYFSENLDQLYLMTWKMEYESKPSNLMKIESSSVVSFWEKKNE